MKANELRVGNWAYKNIGWTLVRTKISIDDFYDVYDSGLTFEEYYEPIPLTPEILEKCGFEKPNENFDLRFSHDSLGLATIEYDPKKQIVYLCFEGTICGIEIKYLHQFQNLYFALTGEELEINL